MLNFDTFGFKIGSLLWFLIQELSRSKHLLIVFVLLPSVDFLSFKDIHKITPVDCRSEIQYADLIYQSGEVPGSGFPDGWSVFIVLRHQR